MLKSLKIKRFRQNVNFRCTTEDDILSKTFVFQTFKHLTILVHVNFYSSFIMNSVLVKLANHDYSAYNLVD